MESLTVLHPPFHADEPISYQSYSDALSCYQKANHKESNLSPATPRPLLLIWNRTSLSGDDRIRTYTIPELYYRRLLSVSTIGRHPLTSNFPYPCHAQTIAHVATSQAEHPELNRDTERDPAHLPLMIYSTYREVLLFTCSTLPQMQGSFSQRFA